MKRLLMAIVALLVIYPTSAMAQTKPQPAPASTSKPAVTKPAPLRAFVEPGTPNLDTIKGQADVFRNCNNDNSSLRLTCKMLVTAFNENPAFDEFDDVADENELADFIESEMEFRQCPATSEKVPIAAVRGDKVVYPARHFRPNEPCLVVRSTNQVFSAAPCTQFLGVKLAAFTLNKDSSIGASIDDPELTNLRESIDDIGRRMALLGDGGQERRSRSNQNSNNQNWWSKNWKWAAPVGAGVAGVVLATVFDVWTNENTNINCVGVPCGARR